MESQKQNDESKSSGMELLENVIKSNERNIVSNDENIEQCVKVQFALEDFLSSSIDIQTGLRGINAKHGEFLELFKTEQSKREEFLANIPNTIETVLSKETIDYLESFKKTTKRMEKFTWSGIGTFILGILTFILSINFATNWYKESIKAKSELRQDILNEISDEGKKIYDENEIKILKENTKVMQIWIKKNPKKAADFLQFKDGFEAKKKE